MYRVEGLLAVLVSLLLPTTGVPTGGGPSSSPSITHPDAVISGVVLGDIASEGTGCGKSIQFEVSCILRSDGDNLMSNIVNISCLETTQFHSGDRYLMILKVRESEWEPADNSNQVLLTEGIVPHNTVQFCQSQPPSEICPPGYHQQYMPEGTQPSPNLCPVMEEARVCQILRGSLKLADAGDQYALLAHRHHKEKDFRLKGTGSPPPPYRYVKCISDYDV